MPVRFMETTSDRSSPLSAEEDNPSDREGRPRANRGTKRKQRNRDAARKSRQKQTERADELHEELQCLEQDNTALEKEIKALRKELDYYTSTLERHESHCCLINKTSPTNTTLSNPVNVPPRTSHPPAPSTSSTSNLYLHTTPPPPEKFSSKFPSALEQHKPHCCLINKTSPTNTTLSTPASVPPRTSHPVTAPAPSTSSTSSLDLHTTPPPPQMFSSTFPPVPHSLFSEKPTSTIPVCSSFIPTTTMNTHKMVERLSQSNISFPVNTTSTVLLPCSTLTMSSHDATFTTEPQHSVTIDLPPMGDLLAAPYPVEGPQSHLDTPFPTQYLLGDPLRDFSLMELLEDNDWILNVQ